MDQAIEHAKAEMAKLEHPPKWRAYTPQFGGTGDVFVWEMEFESLAKLEEFWASWYANPENEEFWKKYNQIAESGGNLEIWNLID